MDTMQANIVQPQIYWCRKCQSETMTANPNCQKCGNKMQTQSTVKSLGKVLIILGIMLVLFSGLGVLIIIAVLLFAKIPNKEIATAYTALVFCSSFLAVCIAIVIGGIRQAKSGRASKTMMWLGFSLMLIPILGRVFLFFLRG